MSCTAADRLQQAVHTCLAEALAASQVDQREGGHAHGAPGFGPFSLLPWLALHVLGTEAKWRSSARTETCRCIVT